MTAARLLFPDDVFDPIDKLLRVFGLSITVVYNGAQLTKKSVNSFRNIFTFKIVHCVLFPQYLIA